jgi:hypothetical protein
MIVETALNPLEPALFCACIDRNTHSTDELYSDTSNTIFFFISDSTVRGLFILKDTEQNIEQLKSPNRKNIKKYLQRTNCKNISKLQ